MLEGLGKGAMLAREKARGRIPVGCDKSRHEEKEC